MANIMLTDACNLNCPYCFANEFVNHDRNEISDEAFDTAANFILGDGTHRTVGLIGGEPTLHSRFADLVRRLIADQRVETIMLYTNGLALDRYWDVLFHPKVRMLVNLNPPSVIGSERYGRIMANLDHLFLECMRRDEATLGINMYGTHFEYDYIIEALKRYSLKHVRTSIVVPNMDEGRNVDAHAYFASMKPRMFEFYHALMDEGIVPYFDCNKIPTCMVTQEELASFKRHLDDPRLKGELSMSNITNPRVVCRPVVDIRQDLTAVRCFGLSQWTKERIADFRGIHELEQYYLRSVDAYAYNTSYSPACNGCHRRKVLECSGGCYAFKIGQILALQRYADGRLADGGRGNSDDGPAAGSRVATAGGPLAIEVQP